MNAPTVDVKDILVADSSLGLLFAKNLFIGAEPIKPDFCVTLFDGYGMPPQLNLSDQGYEYPSINIRVRALDYVTGWNLIDAIKNSLHGRNAEVWNDTLYTVIYCASGPALLDHDENSRARFILNINLQRRENI